MNRHQLSLHTTPRNNFYACMHRRCLHVSLGLIAACLFSCEHIDLGEENTGKEDTQTETSTLPKGTGEGTKEAPLTVKQLQEASSTHYGQSVWVIGYAVGEAYRSLSSSTFASPFTHDSSLLLASDSLCTTASECVPVELSSTSAKATLALCNHPEKHRQCVMVQGTIQKYYSTTGVRSLTNYYWLPAFIIPDTTPTNWDEKEVNY